jgi:PKD repeat protein
MGYANADFTGMPFTGKSPLTVQFTDLSDSGFGDPVMINAWYWDFGDGTTSEEQNPEHTYSYPGTYTVSLTVYQPTTGGTSAITISANVSGYNHNTMTKPGYVVVSDPDGKTEENICLRFATEDTEGKGWSECDGRDWVDPVEDGAYIIQDEQDVPRCIVEDEDSAIYELDTYDRVNFLKPSYVDKADSDGSGGVEIEGSKWSPEHTAGPGNEEKTVQDDTSWVQVRPNDPDNRGQTGYDAAGMRTAQAFGLNVYVDGEKNIAEAETDDIPENGCISYPGVPVSGNRLQYELTFAASEFMFVERKHQILVKDDFGNPAEVTMAEYDLQKEMETDKVLHITRGNNLYDRVSKTNATTAGMVTNSSGPDGWNKSAISFLNNIYLQNPAISGNYSIMVWGILGSAMQFLDGGIPLVLVAYTPLVAIDVTPWILYYSNTLTNLGTNLVFGPVFGFGIRAFDVRIYSKHISNAAIANYYRNVSRNKGEAYLPAYCEI